MLKLRIPKEEIEEMTILKWLHLNGYFAFKFKDQTRRTKSGSYKKPRYGEIRGIPDLCVMLQGGKVIWIEVKRIVGGKQSIYQQSFELECLKLRHPYLLVNGFNDFIDKFRGCFLSKN